MKRLGLLLPCRLQAWNMRQPCDSLTTHMAGTFVSRWMLVALVALFTLPAYALEVQQTLWGFDGKAVPNRFGPISVLVSNPANLAFDGTLSLESAEGPGARGASYVQPVFLAPHTSRWVQFYVRAGSGVGRYELRWGRGTKDAYEFDEPPNVGPPACVWLRDLDSPFAAGGSLKSFPDQLFPTTAVAAESLDAVVLDHIPNWEPARREAFLEWVKLGGTVHLLPAPKGALPVFGEGWKELDSDQEVTHIGRGLVVHHSVAPQEVSEKYLTERGYPPRTIENPKNPAIYDYENIFFRDLSSMTRPKVSWTLINLLMLAYVAVIGPVHNYYRRRLDYRVSLLIFLGCVAVFGVALGITGRRGYGESQTVHSLAIARSLGGGKVDATQWISAFAVTGDRYTLTHRAPANLYAPDRQAESGSGVIFNGKDGYMLADIPLYSARALVHRAIMTADDTAVTVEKWEDDGSLRDLRLHPGPGFPKNPKLLLAVMRDHVYTLTLRDGTLQLSGAAAVPLTNYFSQDNLRVANYQTMDAHASPKTADAFNLHTRVLAALALNHPGVFPTTISAPKNRSDMQLLVGAPAPDSMQLQGKGFAREDGWVLYVQEVSKP